MKKIMIALLVSLVSTTANAHGGGLNSQGCHNKTSDGTYHCHKSQNNTNKQNQAGNIPKTGKACVTTYTSLDPNLMQNQTVYQRTLYYNIDATGFYMKGHYDTGWQSLVPLKGKNNNGSYIVKNNSNVLELSNDKKKRKMIFNKRTNEFFVEWKTFFGGYQTASGKCKSI